MQKNTGAVVRGIKTVDFIILGLVIATTFIGGVIFGGATPQGKAMSDQASTAYEKIVGK